MGDLQKDKFNFWFSVDGQQIKRHPCPGPRFLQDRRHPFASGVSGSSPTTFPGNFSQAATNTAGNLTAPNCAPPLSVVNPTDPKQCIFDFSATIDIHAGHRAGDHGRAPDLAAAG